MTDKPDSSGTTVPLIAAAVVLMLLGAAGGTLVDGVARYVLMGAALIGLLVVISRFGALGRATDAHR